MLRAFGFLQQSADAIVRAAGDRQPQVHGLYPEWSDGLHSSTLGKACPQVFVDDSPEGPARASRLSLKSRRDVFVQCQGSSHSIKMLSYEHHDVKWIGHPH